LVWAGHVYSCAANTVRQSSHSPHILLLTCYSALMLNSSVRYGNSHSQFFHCSLHHKKENISWWYDACCICYSRVHKCSFVCNCSVPSVIAVTIFKLQLLLQLFQLQLQLLNFSVTVSYSLPKYLQKLLVYFHKNLSLHKLCCVSEHEDQSPHAKKHTPHMLVTLVLTQSLQQVGDN